MNTTIRKTFFTIKENDVWAKAETANGRMNRLEVYFDWMPSNSAHQMKFEVIADGPYYSTGSVQGEERITCNKPLILVEALETLAKQAREVYDRAMQESQL